MKIRIPSAFTLVGCILWVGPSGWAASNLVLATRTINWQGISTGLVAQLNQSAGKPVPAFVRFNAPLSLANHQILQASDVQLQDYFRDVTYSVLFPSEAFLTNAAVTGLIFAAEQWLPSDKLQVSTNTSGLPNWAYDPTNNTLNLLVGFWRTVDQSTVTNDLGSVGLIGVRYGADNSWAVVVPTQPLTNFVQTLTNLAALLSVKLIQPGPLPFFPLNSEGRRSARTDDAQGFAFTGPPLTSSNPKYNKASGDAVRVAICDNGMYEPHNDFQPFASSVSRYYHPQPAWTALPGNRNHATHVASVALGNGYDSRNHENGTWSKPFRYRGHAPRALIGNYYTNFGGNAVLFYESLHIDGTHVSNHSYVQSWTVYDLIATSLDTIVRGGPDSAGNLIPARPSVWGAGNNGFESQPNYDNEEGYYSVFTTAKNTISVGSVDTFKTPERLSWFSSCGPTFDRRIKPDIVAPGCRNSISGDFIMAANPAGGYINGAGTSTAAPVVTGIIALMMEQYKRSFCVPPNLHPATYKAILIHTASDLIKTSRWPAEGGGELDWDNPDIVPPSPPPPPSAAGSGPVIYYEGPDFATGYGLVDAEAARAKIANSSQWRQGVILAQGNFQTWCIDVPDGASELKVVIAWDDVAGAPYPNPETAPKLVNDLDLVLKAPDGTIHLPWSLAGLPLTPNPGSGDPDPIAPPFPMTPQSVQPAFRAADHTNNVEMVTVPTPVGGVWQAVITGHELPFPGQTYALVSSHPVLPFCLLPETPVRGICLVFPEICSPKKFLIPKLAPVCKSRFWFPRYFGIPKFIPKGYLRFPTRVPVPIDDICKYVINCPGCEHGPAWQLCAGYQLNMRGLPGKAELIIFDERGEILDRDSGGSKIRTFDVPDHRPGERHFVLVVPRSGEKIDTYVNLKFDFQHREKQKGP